MVVSALVLAAVGGGQNQAMTFAEVEKAKHEAFAKLDGFEGRYDVVNLPSGQRQSIYLTINQKGRKVRVVVEGQPVVESAWTKDSKWLVNHVTAQYSDDKKEGGFTLFEPYKPLVAQPGRANFSVADMGPRFNADPEPELVSDTVVTEDGVKRRRIEAVSKNPDSNGEIRIFQFFDEGSWVCRRFTLEIKAGEEMVFRSNGFLREDKRASLNDSVFAFPTGIPSGYQKVTTGA